GRESTQRTASEIGKKALLALLGGALTFFLTSLSDGPREWSVMFSCFVGSAILIGEFLYGVERRIDAMETALETHHQKMSKLVERRFSEIANVTELFSLVESSPVQSETVRQFLRHAVSLDPSSRLLLDFAHSEISRVSQVLGDLQHGTATYFGEDQDWLLELTRSAQVSIEATSLPTVDAALWNSPLG
nr:hypothetical protein [Micromonospora sp. DSM 115978]